MPWLSKIARKQSYTVVLKDITFIIPRIWSAAMSNWNPPVCVRESWTVLLDDHYICCSCKEALDNNQTSSKIDSTLILCLSKRECDCKLSYDLNNILQTYHRVYFKFRDYRHHLQCQGNYKGFQSYWKC